MGSSSQSEDDTCVPLADEEADEVLFYDSAGEVTILSFAQVINALQTANNESVRGMDRICAVIKSMLPRPSSGKDDQEGKDAQEIPIPSAYALRQILLRKIPHVRRIHVCSQDCVMFIGVYKDLKRCPKCQRLRYFQDKSGRLIPVNVFRSIPLVAQIRLLFSRPEVARALRLPASVCANAANDDVKICDITESIGFKEIVFDSGFMTDLRNLILLLGTDGINPFARTRVSTYSLWPFVFFLANLRRDKRYKFSNVIIGGLASGHVYVDGVKKNRTVKNISVYLDFFVKEMLALANHNTRVVDASYPEGSERRVFYPSAMLLGTMGDYDAHCHMLCMVPAGSICCCIKCNIQGVWYSSVGTRVFAQNRRYLDPDDPRRISLIRGCSESRDPPCTRTRGAAITHGKEAELLKDAIANKQWGSKAALDNLVSDCGITGLCPLLQLPEYDPYDRAFLDYMHLVKNIGWNHLLKRMLGLCPAPPAPRNDLQVWSDAKRSDKSPAVLKARDAKFRQRQAEVTLLRSARDIIVDDDSGWEISVELKQVASARMKALVCPASFYTHSKDLFHFTGSWDTIEWHHFIERCAPTPAALLASARSLSDIILLCELECLAGVFMPYMAVWTQRNTPFFWTCLTFSLNLHATDIRVLN
jgi:hypothetical protein